MKKNFIVIGFWIAISIFVAFSAYSYVTSTRLVKDIRLRTLSFEVHEKLESFRDLIKDMEKELDLYIDTGEDMYLGLFRRRVAAMGPALKEIEGLMTGEPRLRERVGALGSFVKRQISDIEDLLRLYKDGGPDARVMNGLIDKGSELRRIADFELKEIMEKDKALFEDLEEKVMATFRHIVWTLSLGAVLTFAIIIWIFRLLNREIAERKLAGEKLEQAMEDLRRSNVELEEFAHVASHDLKEPLIVLASDLKLIKRQMRGLLDAEAEELVSDAIERATRMQSLISDILAYSRAGYGLNLVRADFADILGRTLDNMKVSIEKCGAVITHDALPQVTADKVQMGQLFQNLISNALKFRSSGQPHIHISAVRVEDFGKDEAGPGTIARDHLSKVGNGWVFSVRDDGIGIAPEQTEKIFELFQRLHKSKYKGSGIGLATCRKIVERHGGRIWVRSEPGKGSTFYFTIAA